MSQSQPRFELIEVGGFIAAIEGMRYPTKSVGDSEILNFNDRKCAGFNLGPRDTKLAADLIAKGPVHSKFCRGITAWFRINMPIAIWSELDTYTIGTAPISSESTMYTLIKECGNITEDMFVDGTSKSTIEGFKKLVEEFTLEYGTRKDIPINKIKYALPGGWLQKRNRAFSYQCLKNMHRDRINHRMPEWTIICKSIEQLPYFKELILGEISDDKSARDM